MKRIAFVLSFLVFFLPMFRYRIDTETTYAFSLLDLATLNMEASTYMFLLNRIISEIFSFELTGSGFGYLFLLLWVVPICGFMAMISAFSSYRKYDAAIFDILFFSTGLLMLLVVGSFMLFNVFSNQSFDTFLLRPTYGLYVLSAVFFILVYNKRAETDIDDDEDLISNPAIKWKSMAAKQMGPITGTEFNQTLKSGKAA